jgi:hypothetical protein
MLLQKRKKQETHSTDDISGEEWFKHHFMIKPYLIIVIFQVKY